MTNFWKKLPVPFTVLAPMEDVTDVVFREIVYETAPPDVFFTEFTSSDGLFSPGRESTIRRLQYTNNQRPIVAQIWGTDPEKMFQSAQLVEEMKFDGVDINMGCPARTITDKGSGSAHIKNPALAREIIDAVKKGAPNIAVSVKTRLGFNKVITEEWIPFLLEQKIDALTIHGRTAVQMSNGEADWNEIAKAVKYRDDMKLETVIIGNGDITSYKQVVEKHEHHNIDGVMIGRGIFANPWVFEKNINPETHHKDEYIELLLKHVRLFEDTWGKQKNFEIMKKFFKMYVREFEGASEMREKLMQCKTAEEVEAFFGK